MSTMPTQRRSSRVLSGMNTKLESDNNNSNDGSNDENKSYQSIMEDYWNQPRNKMMGETGFSTAKRAQSCYVLLEKIPNPLLEFPESRSTPSSTSSSSTVGTSTSSTSPKPVPRHGIYLTPVHCHQDFLDESSDFDQNSESFQLKEEVKIEPTKCRCTQLIVEANKLKEHNKKLQDDLELKNELLELKEEQLKLLKQKVKLEKRLKKED